MNIKFPVKYKDGCVVDTEGNVLLKANRESSTTPLTPAERDDLIKMVVYLLNTNEDRVNEEVLDLKFEDESLNEEVQILDKVRYNKDRGYVTGEIEGKVIVMIQGSTYLVDPKDLKEWNNKPDLTTQPHMKFDEQTQKLLFEQFVRCGVYSGNIPIRLTDCYVQYSHWEKADDDRMIKVLVEGNATFLPKSQVRILEDINDFANEDNYVPGVLIDEATEEVIENILVQAIDYTDAIGDADSVRIIRKTPEGEQEIQTVPKSMVRTLAI
jgi:hypothetical protein